MRIIKLKYAIWKGIKVPIIPLELCYREEWKTVWAYVDSGATYSIFDLDTALRLGIEDIKIGERVDLRVGDGDFLPVYLHRISVRIEGEKFESLIGFSEELKIGFNLLGRIGIFDKFKVCFDDRKGILALSAYEIN